MAWESCANTTTIPYNGSGTLKKQSDGSSTGVDAPFTYSGTIQPPPMEWIPIPARTRTIYSATEGASSGNITHTNTGDVPLSNVTVSDLSAPNCSKSLGDVGIGVAHSYTRSNSSDAQTYVNTATVTGLPPVGSAVSNEDTAEVQVVSKYYFPLLGNNAKFH